MPALYRTGRVIDDLSRVTEGLEREELDRGQVAPGELPTRPRPAATLVLARAGPVRGDPAAFEILLLRRPGQARFAPGAFVFPGGTIDHADGAAELRHRLPEQSAEGESPALVAALRELFEETGILVSDRPVPLDAASAARAALLRGSLTFPEIVYELDVSFRELRVVYMARWVTPARFARRYDTRFFLTEPPVWVAQQEPELTEELTDFVWIDPAEALRRLAAGRLPMLFPTRTTLEELAQQSSLSSAIESFRARQVHPVEPRLLVRADSVRPVLPGQPGYEEAT